MNTTIRCAALVGLLALSVACGSSGPASPTTTSQPEALPTAPAPLPPTSFPPLSGPSRTFIFDHGLAYPNVAEYTKNSRFVLYENGAFALRYDSLGGEYRGSYSEANGVIAFAWEGWSAAGSWGATGTLEGESLKVQYNLIMLLSDFEDAMYVLMR